MNNHFSIGMRGEVVAAAQKPGAKLREVVDFPVEYNPSRAVLVKYRLVASRKIDDAKAPHAQARTVFDENSFVVRAPMDNRLAHAVNCGDLNPIPCSRAHDARNSAHALSSHAHLGI